MISAGKENISCNIAESKHGSYGKVMSALCETMDEKLAVDLEQQEEKRVIEERTKLETKDLLAAVKLQREMQDEEFANKIAADDARELENFQQSEAKSEQDSYNAAIKLQEEMKEQEEKDVKDRDEQDLRLAQKFQLQEEMGQVKDLAHLEEIWKTADFEIQKEDICAALKLLIYLPFIGRIDLAVQSKKSIRIQAEAQPPVNLLAAEVNRSKPIKFKKTVELVCNSRAAAIKDSDLKYEYDSNSGMLMIAVDLKAVSPSEKQSILQKLKPKFR